MWTAELGKDSGPHDYQDREEAGKRHGQADMPSIALPWAHVAEDLAQVLLPRQKEHTDSHQPLNEAPEVRSSPIFPMKQVCFQMLQ